MSENFDFIVVGGGSAGAVIASRLSEDPSCRVALIEAGERPPEVSLMPVAPAAMQLNPATDWMYTADPGKAGLGLNGRRVPVPRGKMLGGSSSLNYMMYVRGHPGDFDSWAAGGATGWSYAEVLPYFRKSEGLAPNADIPIDMPAHNSAGPLGVSARAPALRGANEFVEAAVAAGIPRGDYNGRERGGATGAVSLTQYTIRQGKRSSTYYAFLEGEPEQRPNLTIITGAQATRVILKEEAGHLTATGVEYRTGAGEVLIAYADKEVILSAGAIGSPHRPPIRLCAVRRGSFGRLPVGRGRPGRRRTAAVRPGRRQPAFPGTGGGRGARAPARTKRSRVGRQSSAGHRARSRRRVQ